ncbi:hypothetical protein D9757_003609 [Collybiopsis confluens]|uniref:Uncharacterized protein n=1 Tax=Collybiopsis confluens TaxID=2823264 RepID=A0A8H5MDF6_9AGAR|nr:hypothetical protein D9757_003609 [Collybiopsis confluens]
MSAQRALIASVYLENTALRVAGGILGPFIPPLEEPSLVPEINPKGEKKSNVYEGMTERNPVGGGGGGISIDWREAEEEEDG